jgi:hypothetical protein
MTRLIDAAPLWATYWPVDRAAIEQLAILLEDVGFRSLADDGLFREHEDVFQLLDRDMQSHPVTWAKPP